jgi:hypothetical protein
MYGSNFCLGIQRLVSRDYVTPNIGQSSHQPKARVLPDYHPSPRGTMFSYCAMISVTPFPGLAADCATFWLHSALNVVGATRDTRAVAKQIKYAANQRWECRTGNCGE